MRMPVARTTAPPSTIWNIAFGIGMSMQRARTRAIRRSSQKTTTPAGAGAGQKGGDQLPRHKVGQGCPRPPTAVGAADRPARQRRAAPRHQSVVRRGFGEAHRDAGAERGGKSDREGRPVVVSGEAGGKQRRQHRHRAVHQSGEAGWHVVQDERPALARRFAVAGIGGIGRGRLSRRHLVSVPGRRPCRSSATA